MQAAAPFTHGTGPEAVNALHVIVIMKETSHASYQTVSTRIWVKAMARLSSGRGQHEIINRHVE
jgi:hypothetical protein